MRKSVGVTLGFALLIVLSLAFTNEPPRYKNLKVLPKNTSKEQIDSVMHHFTAALGVKCNFCHVFNQEQKAMDFASDANEHKNIARSMMRMTQKINKKFFDVKHPGELSTTLEVTCYTCHNGKEHPGKFAPAKNREEGPGRAAADSTKRQ